MRWFAVLAVITAQLVSAEPKASCEEVRHQRYTAHFKRVELTELAQTISDATCRSFIVGDGVKGTISLIGPENGTQTFDSEQFYAAFLAALDANGLTVLKQGRYYRIIEKRLSRQHPMPLALEPSEYPAQGEVVTRVFKVKNAELETLKGVLSQFISPNGDLLAAPPDALIATDLVSNLQRLERLLALLDVSRPLDVMRLIAVKHADASDVADKVNRLFAPKPGAGPKPVETLTTAVDERTNRLMVVGSPLLLERVDTFVATLDIEMPGDGRARVYRLKNADAKDVAAALEGMTQGAKSRVGGSGGPPSPGGGLSSEVRITPSEAQNALVIVASAGDYRSLVEVIEQLDVPVRQVFIETLIMEVNVDQSSALGLSFHAGGTVAGAPFVVGSEPAGTPSSLSLSNLASSSGLLAGVQGPLLTQLSSALGLALPQFGVAIQASATNSDVNVISTPHILTSDNKEAIISVGQKVPFQLGMSAAQLAALAAQGNATTASTLATYGQNIQREKVELKLTVKPHIGDGDQIRLEIDQQSEEIASGTVGTLGPTTSTRGQKTSVVARDAETLVLGGIMQDREIDSVTKVPGLGDIPILGHLFRSTTKKKTKVNLLVFLTPHIIREPKDFQDVMNRKTEERHKLLEQFYGPTPDVAAGIDFSRKRGPLSSMLKAVEERKTLPENGGPPLKGDRLVAPRSAPSVLESGDPPPGTLRFAT